MSDHLKNLQEAFQLRKEKKLDDALRLYELVWQQHAPAFTEWDGWSYAWCLKEKRQYLKALDICRIFYKRYPQSQIIAQLYANCIYYTQFANTVMPTPDVAKKAALAMYNLCPPHQKYSLTGKAIFKVCKLLMAQSPVDWKEINNLLQRLDPDLLDDKPYSIAGPGGKTIEYASALEEWYSLMIKLKAGIEDPNGLLALLEAAKNRRLRWHYSNHIWFARKEAFAYIQLNQKEKAEKILRNIISQKKDWFLLQDLAEVVTDTDEALRLLACAALSPGETDKKIRLFYSIYGKLKDKAEYLREAKLHLSLVSSIRKHYGWAIPPALQTELTSNGISITADDPPGKLIESLSPFWKKWAAEGKTMLTGVIEKILDGNASGFVKSTDGKHYYFLMKEAKTLGRMAVAGCQVSFELEEGFDRKKQAATKNAVRLMLKS